MDGWYMLLLLSIVCLTAVSVFTTLATLEQEFVFHYPSKILNSVPYYTLIIIELLVFLSCIIITRLKPYLRIHTFDVVWFYSLLKLFFVILVSI
jgi:ABC-type uncharacterized transport system permease subunit